MDVLHQRFLSITSYLEGIYMKNKDKTISLRLSNEEYTILESNSNLHTAVSSGSWCGGQRQQCGDSGSGLR